MLTLAASSWVSLVTAVLFGAVVAGSCAAPGRPSRIDKAAGSLMGFALTGLIVASGQGMLGGRAGVWLNLGLLILAAYLIGCCLGCLFHRLARRALGEAR